MESDVGGAADERVHSSAPSTVTSPRAAQHSELDSAPTAHVETKAEGNESESAEADKTPFTPATPTSPPKSPSILTPPATAQSPALGSGSHPLAHDRDGARAARIAARTASLPGMRATRSTFGKQIVARRVSAPAYSFGARLTDRFGDPAGSPTAGTARLPRGAGLTALPQPSPLRMSNAASPGPASYDGYRGSFRDGPKWTMSQRPPSVFERTERLATSSAGAGSSRRRAASASPQASGKYPPAERGFSVFGAGKRGFTFGAGREDARTPTPRVTSDVFYKLPSSFGKQHMSNHSSPPANSAWGKDRVPRFESACDEPTRASRPGEPRCAHCAVSTSQQPYGWVEAGLPCGARSLGDDLPLQVTKKRLGSPLSWCIPAYAALAPLRPPIPTVAPPSCRWHAAQARRRACHSTWKPSRPSGAQPPRGHGAARTASAAT